ncbi:General transcription factor IIH subunit 3 [Tyrophagus putrescentiae]|nr:General transcription factor IIH subunit 3 [Tyrophagus putrescentiae]
MDAKAICDGTHVVIIIDLLLKPGFDSSIFLQTIDSILAFGTSLILQSGANKVTILGSSNVKNDILFADLPEFATDGNSLEVSGGQVEKLAQITTTFNSNFSRWITACSRDAESGADVAKSSMVSGSIAQALCLINRHRSEYSTSRIIVFSLGADVDHYSSQYMKLINCFFAAQKADIVIDSCSVGMSREQEESSNISASMEDRFAASILQQGSDLTGGRYIRVHKVSTLLEHLFWCFTPGSSERALLVLPPKLKICPPAACFCHRKVLDIGYVCSVCVSVFCQFLPFCSTCQSNVFVNNLKKIAQLKTSKATDEKIV